MRSKARECAFKVIFAGEFSDSEDVRRALYRTSELNKEEREYADLLCGLVKEHREELAAVLDKYSIGFSEKRIFPADKSIMFVALAEILYMDDIPDKVSLNEAANIASKYSSEKSASFITGVLSAICGGKNV